jgi:hypothetical protein
MELHLLTDARDLRSIHQSPGMMTTALKTKTCFISFPNFIILQTIGDIGDGNPRLIFLLCLCQIFRGLLSAVAAVPKPQKSAAMRCWYLKMSREYAKEHQEAKQVKDG